MMVASDPAGCPHSGLGLASGQRYELWGGSITLGTLLLGLLVLSACGGGSKYFQDGVNEATQAMVGKRYGTPHKVQPSTDGGETWTYFERGSGTAGFSGQARGGGCRAYVLQFDKQTILRDWQQQPCQG